MAGSRVFDLTPRPSEPLEELFFIEVEGSSDPWAVCHGGNNLPS